MGSERRQAFHVLEVGVEVTSRDHGPIEGFEQSSGDADQLILYGVWIRSSSHDFASGKPGAVEVVLVGHQPSEAFPVGDAGGITRVVEQS